MNTQAFVQEVNNLITFINGTSVSDVWTNFRDEDGYTDYDGAEIDIDQTNYSISYLLANATNPTLPCLSRLSEAAQQQGYFVDYRAAA